MVSPPTGISVPRGRSMHKSVFASAKRWQSRAFHYRTTYLYPLGTGHLRIRHPERPSNTPSHTSVTLLLPHARTSSCLTPGRRQHLIAGNHPGFRYLPHSYRESENVPAVLCQLLACTEFTFPDLTPPHFSHHPIPQTILKITSYIPVSHYEYVLLRNASTPIGRQQRI